MLWLISAKREALKYLFNLVPCAVRVHHDWMADSLFDPVKSPSATRYMVSITHDLDHRFIG
jgi:hypothetical protein